LAACFNSPSRGRYIFYRNLDEALALDTIVD
jgi:hypothetical protein